MRQLAVATWDEETDGAVPPPGLSKPGGRSRRPGPLMRMKKKRVTLRSVRRDLVSSNNTSAVVGNGRGDGGGGGAGPAHRSERWGSHSALMGDFDDQDVCMYDGLQIGSESDESDGSEGRGSLEDGDVRRTSRADLGVDRHWWRHFLVRYLFLIRRAVGRVEG